MNDSTILIPGVFLLLTVILGLFMPRPRRHALDEKALKQAIWLVGGLAVLSVLLFVDGVTYWGITVACASEGLFMLLVWLSAPASSHHQFHRERGDYFDEGEDWRWDEPEGPPPPIDWDEFSRSFQHWSRNRTPQR